MKELFDKFLMYFCFAGIGAIAVVAFVRVTLPAAVREARSAARKAKKSGPAVIIPVLCVAGLIVYGSTKNNSPTNDSPAQQQMASQSSIRGELQVEKIVADALGARPLQSAGVASTQSLELNEAQPTNSLVRVEKWWRRGAYNDGQILTFDQDWCFPYGTNHLMSVEVWASGAVYASMKAPSPIAELLTKLSLAPHDTEVFMGRTTNNTYRIEWHHGHPNRDASQIADASIELFRNGNVVVTEDGMQTEIPYDIPFEHDGFGQDDDWVRANFTNAEEIISIGYASWVDQQVGVGQLNGLYKFSAVVTSNPPECLNLRVGDCNVAVTNVGEYVFLLGKGFRYDIDVYPRTFTNINFSATDDLGSSRLSRLAVHPSVNNGHWTEDQGSVEIVVSNPMVPLAPSMSFVLWRPTLFVSPQNWQPSELNDEETFTAVLTDVPWFATPSYHWNTADSSVVSVDSPHSESTRMICHFPNANDSRPSLSLEVCLAGCTLDSYYAFDHNGDGNGGVSLTFSIPEVLFVNNDDDNDDGNADDASSVDTGDDDVGYGRLLFHAPYPTNGTIVVESISGYDMGFSDHGLLFSDRACTQEIEEGSEFRINDATSFAMPMYFNAATVSTSYPGVQIKARWRPAQGSDVVASGYTTVVMPIVEPICNEATNIVVNGVSRNLVINPCGVGIGKEAYFKIKVQPEAFPDEKITWEAAGGIEFVGGNTGRAVKVRGLATGSTHLKIKMRDSDFDNPEFPLYVTSCTNIPIHVVVVNDEHSAPLNPDVSAMISVANDIYEQIGVSFYLGSMCVTNIPAAFQITEEDANNGMWCHDRLTSLLSNTNGIECYFVDDMVDENRNTLFVNGMTSSSGIVLVRSAPNTTMAHEIGHLCGSRDIYTTDRQGGMNLLRDKVCWSYSSEDWNGGCLGHGSAGARYYSYGMGMTEIVSRMLMNGRASGNGVDRHYDMTLGWVYGIRKYGSNGYRKDDVPVGFKSGGGFNIPHCE